MYSVVAGATNRSTASRASPGCTMLANALWLGGTPSKIIRCNCSTAAPYPHVIQKVTECIAPKYADRGRWERSPFGEVYSVLCGTADDGDILLSIRV